MADDKLITYMDYQWVEVDGNTVTIGISDEGLIDVDEIKGIELPPENEPTLPDEVCGEIETADGSIDLYAPVRGKISEINQAVLENPDLLIEDPFGEGWLFRIESENPKELAEFVENAGVSDDDVEDEEEEDEEGYDEDDEEEDEEESPRGGGRGRPRYN